jgi:hypothetical protein
MNTWPISIALQAERLWLGIPDHLADGGGDTDVAKLPTLEERCGESWSQQLLRVLLPQDRAWAWWTRNAIFRRSKLSAANAPERVFPQRAVQVLRRNVWMHQMSLCLIPSADALAQQAVLDWAGVDTEQIPDHLWSAAANEREWDLEQISAWYRARAGRTRSPLLRSRPSGSSCCSIATCSARSSPGPANACGATSKSLRGAGACARSKGRPNVPG